ncbi:MAG: UDP-N-acetylglucosamine 1-carboxyvinyltransferase, partial [Clostridia bacterium]|nr:UDP-N-acetylglucosamine 1-carboxyvinyltransferase [Clostridia bacterium]
AGTFMMAALASKGDVTVKNCISTHLSPIISKLEEMGAEVTDNFDSVRVKYVNKLNSVHIKTLPYPGFPTDMQPQAAIPLCLAGDKSIITETIWSSRFQYTNELKKMNASIDVNDKTATISGVSELKGAPVYATDLRAGVALIIAGITAKGTTEIFNIDHIDRGYENIENKFKKLGAKITREKYDK